MNEEKKIQLKEFFNSKEELCIHCDTEEQADKLLEEFNNEIKKGQVVDYRLTSNHWNEKATDTVYYNDGSYSDLEYARNHNHKIYEFNDIIFSDNTILDEIKFKTCEEDKLSFGKILKSIISLQKNIKQPIYVIARYWLGKFQGIEDIISTNGDNDLEEMKQIFKNRYTYDFGITEISHKILKINISEIEKTK